jgi:hypothetical protein
MTSPDGCSLRGTPQGGTRCFHFHDGSSMVSRGSKMFQISRCNGISGMVMGVVESERVGPTCGGQCGRCDADTRRSRLKAC